MICHLLWRNYHSSLLFFSFTMSNFESIRAEMKKDLQDPLENLQKTLAQCNYLEESAKKTLADCEHIIVGDGTVTNP